MQPEEKEQKENAIMLNETREKTHAKRTISKTNYIILPLQRIWLIR